MLFMVIEHFKNGDTTAVGERFRQKGRMLPDGVIYRASWMELNGARCFQLMEAPDTQSLQSWTKKWDDLVNFQISEVLTSDEFWSKVSLHN